MTKELKRRWLAGVSGAIILLAGPALAGATSSNEEINLKLDALEQQIQDLKASQSSQFAESQRAAAAQPTFNLNNGRPTFTSADGNFSAALRALVQLDAGYYDQSKTAPAVPTNANDLSSGSNFRRARIGLSGKFFKVWDYYFFYDFGGSGVEGSTISQAYIQYNGFGPAFAIRAGAFPPYANLEDSEGAGNSLFIERASATEIARSLAGGDGRAAIAITSTGPNYLASIAYTGGKVGDTAIFDEQQGVVGRLAYLPWNTANSKLVIGVNGTYVFDTADAAAGAGAASTGINFQNQPELRVDDNSVRLVSTGNINANSAYHWGADAAANWKNLYAEGGYYGFGADRRGVGAAGADPNFSGWYGAASWILTGEARKWDGPSASFRSPTVTHPVNGTAGGIGAWELAARYSVIDLNWHQGLPGVATPAGGIRGGEQKIWTAGFNWYPNNALRVLFNYQHDEIDRINGGTAPLANARIGQDLDAVSVRLQVAL